MRMGLTAKLTTLLACIGILSSGVTGYYSYSANQNLLVNEAESNLLTSTELLSQRFSSLLLDISADALTIGSLPSAPMLVGLGEGPEYQAARARLAGVFATFMRLHPQYSQMRLISRQAHGLELIRFDRDGEAIVQVEGDKLQEKGHFPYVFETLELAPGHVYISPITVNHEQGAHSAEGAPSLRLATAVLGANGEALGVAVINVDLRKFLETLKADLPARYQMYLTNQWGDFLVHPDASKTFAFDKGQRILIQDSFAQTKSLFNDTTPSVLVNGLDDPQRADGKIMAFVRKSFGPPENRQFVVVGLARPLQDVLGSGKTLGHSIIQMVLVFSLLAIALAILFSRALTHPLQMLIHAARRFQTGHTLDEALPVEREDEIGVLARGFDQMRKELKSHLEVMGRTQQELRHLANHDSLTGLPNRMQFFQQMEQAIAETAGTHQQLAVLFIDLDHFKSINDQMGHAVGDEVLMVVASRLRRAVRSDDIVARLGGDEFVVLIRGAGIAPIASSVTRKILGALNERVTLNGAVLQIGASVGISLYPEDGVTAEDLILRADSAMYKAKVNGRRTFASHQAGVLEIEKHQPGPSAEGTLGAAERANAGAEDDIER
ncbi:diguanylate cyclase domain-containing protein [Pseudomonas panipatensis]|uniref:Diguanylate cyclase (GGDEF) domain-containing protein n=1 Tax=Pseudomonas panipatensis TaxID=428992 RepID=A0A1G8L1I6_9PSED|nr:diguanylate cyclase [Pseudomonas panipatensis]SDI49000.1 diguanylate cyclase (GGDEF) domain-containing protein [Pseudomonas panipatensis]SMP72908.1 diguanylate cyclase (GGDEF) domain-containing protein [Pseudomonas panipatensis]